MEMALKNDGGMVTTDRKEIASILAKQFNENCTPMNSEGKDRAAIRQITSSNVIGQGK